MTRYRVRVRSSFDEMYLHVSRDGHYLLLLLNPRLRNYSVAEFATTTEAVVAVLTTQECDEVFGDDQVEVVPVDELSGLPGPGARVEGVGQDPEAVLLDGAGGDGGRPLGRAEPGVGHQAAIGRRTDVGGGLADS